MFTKDKIDPSKIALGCEPDPNQDGVLVCNPRYEYEGSMVPLCKDLPIRIEMVEPKKWRIQSGGTDLTAEKIQLLKKALQMSELEK